MNNLGTLPIERQLDDAWHALDCAVARRLRAMGASPDESTAYIKRVNATADPLYRAGDLAGLQAIVAQVKAGPCPVCGAEGSRTKSGTGEVGRLLSWTCTACGWHYTNDGERG